MKKFDNLVNNVYSRILLEQDQQAIPQNGGPVQPGAAQAAPAAPAPAAPPPAPEPPAEPEKITPEGKLFLVDLIRKALAISPDSLSPEEKSVFSDSEIQSDNVEEILNKLQQIITDHQ